MRQPDFVGIGAPRTGTTWLFEMLKEHPEVEIPSEKAVNFFNANYEKGKDWYYDHFSAFKQKVVGEISPLYFGNSFLGERLHETAPDAKLILITRDPIERLSSHVKLIDTLSGNQKSASERVKEHPLLLEHGLYYKHLKELLKFYDRDKILVVSYKEISNDAPSAYARVTKFLDVDISYRPKGLNEKVGFNISPKYKWLESMRKSVHNFLTRNGLSNIIWYLKKKGLTKMLRRFNDSSKDQPVAQVKQAKESMELFHDFYKEDLASFEQEFNLNIRNN